MGLLKFDMGNVLNNDAFMLGMGILGNNNGHYGAMGPALGGGLMDYTRLKTNALNRNLSQQDAQLRQQRFNQQQAQQQIANDRANQQWNWQQSDRERMNEQRKLQQEWIKQNHHSLIGAPDYAVQAAIKAQYPEAASYGTTPHFGPDGKVYQLSNKGGVRELPVQLQKPLQFIDYGGGKRPTNPITGQQVGQDIISQLPPEKQPENIKAQEQAKGEVKQQFAADEAALMAEGAKFYVDNARKLVNDMNEAQLGPIAGRTPNFSENAQLLEMQLNNMIGNVRGKMGPGVLSNTDVEMLKSMIPNMRMDKSTINRALDLFETELMRIIERKTGYKMSNGSNADDDGFIIEEL